jgi:hypothetical protein
MLTGRRLLNMIGLRAVAIFDCIVFLLGQFILLLSMLLMSCFPLPYSLLFLFYSNANKQMTAAAAVVFFL